MEQHHPMFVRIWRFQVRPEKAGDFLATYGPAGPWATLFHRVAGYLGTDLLHSATEPDIFFTVDRWESPETWAAFLRAWGDDYAALDRRCESLTDAEAELGEFRRL
jgi:heme-degrading monooxygenase HmoA